MKMKRCCVEPYSEAEKRLVDLLHKAFKRNGERYSVQLGAIYGVPYNAYFFSESTYNTIQQIIKEESA